MKVDLPTSSSPSRRIVTSGMSCAMTVRICSNCNWMMPEQAPDGKIHLHVSEFGVDLIDSDLQLKIQNFRPRMTPRDLHSPMSRAHWPRRLTLNQIFYPTCKSVPYQRVTPCAQQFLKFCIQSTSMDKYSQWTREDLVRRVMDLETQLKAQVELVK
jgi:hypothetical protein